tara:strand:- start:1369 stop:1863 length:495 start_codon:yes stop_codon:yes gene_type:complete
MALCGPNLKNNMTEIQEEIKNKLYPLKKALDERFGIDIFDKSRTKEYIKARQFFVGYVYKHYNYSYIQLAVYMKLNHSNLINTNNKFLEFFSHEDKYKKQFESVVIVLDLLRLYGAKTEKYSSKKRLLDFALAKADEELVDYVYSLLYKNPLTKKEKALTPKSR